MKFSLTLKELKEKLNKFDSSFDNYEVTFKSEGTNYFITMIKTNKREQEIHLTNGSKYSMWDR